MPLSQEAVLAKLAEVIDPELHRDIVSLGMVKNLAVSPTGDVSLTVELTTPACPLKEKIEADVRGRLAELSGIGTVTLEMTGRVTRPTTAKNSIPGVSHIIAVGSGKGGVGKSTVAVNLAIALARDGARVGLLDADIYGPNVPTMLGVHEPRGVENETIHPAEAHGLRIVSMGFFLDPDEPVIWRGPMLHGAMRQFFQNVAWGELDYLVVDLPPGTGDVQLSMAQMVPVSGAVIVCTPQKVALDDCRKAVAMFRKVEIPILGVVENMSYLTAPVSGERVDLFGAGGAEAAAAEWKVRFLGALPIDPRVAQGGDAGRPVALGDDALAGSFRDVARQAAGEVSRLAHSRPREISLDGLILQS